MSPWNKSHVFQIAQWLFSLLSDAPYPHRHPVFVCTQDYELNFGLWEKHVDNTWHGGVATIESRPGAEVWGVIWTLRNEHVRSLDKWESHTRRHSPFQQCCRRFLLTRCGSSSPVARQEGVCQGRYSPLEVLVETDQGMMLCRTYQINNFHACPPSPQYKHVNANADPRVVQ